jgi:hypothetical protein
MSCPQCRTEYREGFYTCRDCGVSLVSELPPPECFEFEERGENLHIVLTPQDSWFEQTRLMKLGKFWTG